MSARRILVVRCGACGKVHTTAHAAPFGGPMLCPCGARIDPFTGSVISK